MSSCRQCLSESCHCSRALIQTDGFHKRAHARRADTLCPRSITRWWPTHPPPLPRCPRALSNTLMKVSRRTSKPQNQGTLPTSQILLALPWHKVAIVQHIWELEPGKGALWQLTSVVLAKGLQGTCISFTKCNGWRVRRSGNATTIANCAMRPPVCPSALASILACAICRIHMLLLVRIWHAANHTSHPHPDMRRRIHAWHALPPPPTQRSGLALGITAPLSVNRDLI